jgi:DNA-binding IscR family transcriptional regulator
MCSNVAVEQARTAQSIQRQRTLQVAALCIPGLTRICDVAGGHGIRRNYATKIVHMLGGAVYLGTICGGSGLRRVCPAASYTIVEVIRVTEGCMVLVEYLGPTANTWPLLGICHPSARLREATRALLAVLDRTIVADIEDNRGALLVRIWGAAYDRQRPDAPAAPAGGSTGAR